MKDAIKEQWIHQSDLPLTCPNRQTPVQLLHPRVFLPLKNNQAHCPYCGTTYHLDPKN